MIVRIFKKKPYDLETRKTECQFTKTLSFNGKRNISCLLLLSGIAMENSLWNNIHPIFPHVLNLLAMIKGIFRDYCRDNALNFNKIRDVCILVMVLDISWYMNLTLKGIVKICPRSITKRHYILSLKKKSNYFFQTDNQPTVDTNVTGNHNIRQHDSLYILVE